MPYAAEEYAQMFRRHRAALLDLLELIPDPVGEAVPWDGGRGIRTSLTTSTVLAKGSSACCLAGHGKSSLRRPR